MKYLSQLSHDEIKDLFVALNKGVGKTYTVALEDSIDFRGNPSMELIGQSPKGGFVSYELDDYTINSSMGNYKQEVKLTRILRSFMLDKFGKQYVEDCFWNHLEGDDGKSKESHTNPNLDTINKWRQVINGVSKGD